MADQTLEHKALADLFSEISSIAFDAVEDSRAAPSPQDDPTRALRHELQLARTLAQIGWLADIGAKRLGGAYMLEGAEDWLLSPRARSSMSEADIAQMKAEGRPA
jgi:hypothetical protein